MDPGSPPGPGWTLGEDGHWKPPPFEVGGPAAPAGPVPPAVAPPPAGVPPWPPPAAGASPQPPQWPPPQSGSSAKTAGVVVASVLGAFALVAVVCIAAVTMLGTESPERFESVSTPTTDAADRDRTTGPEDTEPTDDEPTGSGDEALVASAAIVDHLSGEAWELKSDEPLPLESTEACSPSGWNTGAVNRHSSVYEHLTGADADGEVTINVTVYGSEDDAAADLDRAGSSEWFECQRKRIDRAYGDPDPEFEAIPEDPQAPGVAYIEHFVVDGERSAETVHYVFVGQVRATITYCGCTSLGLDGRQTVARDVAAALADVQGLPAPGREGN